MRIVDRSEMREIESVSQKIGFGNSMIIENIGMNGAIRLLKLMESESLNQVVIIVGRGNNGADAAAIARHLHNQNVEVILLHLYSEKDFRPELLEQIKLCRIYGVRVFETKTFEDLTHFLNQVNQQTLLIDGILGIGLNAALSEDIYQIISYINDLGCYKVSLDLPSGASASEAQIHPTVLKADLTLAIGLPKVGHFLPAGAQNSGTLEVLSSGISERLYVGGDKFLLTREMIKEAMPRRDMFAYKNIYGHSLVIGGSKGLVGALLMSSLSNLKSGAGLVTSLTWNEVYDELTTRLSPEIMSYSISRSLENIENNLPDVNKFDSILIGPGLGISPESRELVLNALKYYNGPLVIDADAINVLNADEDLELISRRNHITVMTPHLGELARFLKISKEDIPQNPIELLKATSEKFNTIILLKGPATFLAIPSGDIFINYRPNDGMATGGSGDVLAGIINGLFSQLDKNEKDFEKYFGAVATALYIHSEAGHIARQKMGVRMMSATDIIASLGEAFQSVEHEIN